MTSGGPASLLPSGEQPLEGVVVVSLKHAVAAPLASRQPADLGARVVKAERVEGGDFARDYDHTVEGTTADRTSSAAPQYASNVWSRSRAQTAVTEGVRAHVSSGPRIPSQPRETRD